MTSLYIRIAELFETFSVRRHEKGQGLAEYALILALIAIVAIVGLVFLGSQINDQMNTIGSRLQNPGP